MEVNLSTYEQERLEAIEQFKNPKEGWLERLFDVTEVPIDMTRDAVFDSPAGEPIAKTVSAILAVLQDVALWTVRDEALLGEFEALDGEFKDLSAIQRLSLEEVDGVIGRLSLKYKVLGMAGGAVTGLFGPVASASSTVALVTLALRAINEYAMYYGFDIRHSETERQYALAVLAVSTASSDAARQELLAHATAMAQTRAGGGPTLDLQHKQLSQNAKGLAESLAMGLAKGKVAQSVPGAGALIGAGFDKAILTSVCETAHNLYRERFLMHTHGPAIAVVVQPA